jgi:hypothetical protein
MTKDDAIKAIEGLVPDGVKPSGVALNANITIAQAIEAIRALPDAGWRDISEEKLNAWRFNVMLECQGGDGKCAIGGAELDLNDLLAILDAVSDALPHPPEKA